MAGGLSPFTAASMRVGPAFAANNRAVMLDRVWESATLAAENAK